MTLGEYLLNYRRVHRVSQREFAKMCNYKITCSYVSMLERNSRPASGKPIAPSIETVKTVAEATGITFGELIDLLDGDQLVRIESEDARRLNEAEHLLRSLSPDKFEQAVSYLKFLNMQ